MDHGIERTPPNKPSYYIPNEVYSLNECKKESIKAAEELGYTSRYPEIRKRIKEANTRNEVYMILTTYRKKFFGD